ncbi:DUF309 domain-containing protein [Sulfurimonas aquatica]|uniref:DUF309 domain-containing protein n=1 Tax=Sulfurimonas aquatica TaxID=2672570 RepID=A0A975GBI8_9BACT|nr:DUF309 domain-containing protein [Sulfurimonas aquatica]QSZ40716.1 DUF309 domain-containing protein [Sulfurimonas aquatica]
MINKKIDEYIECIQEHRYYDAHEALEEVWFPRRFEKSHEVKLIKGFINASVSFELIKLGRIPQSKKVWATYLKHRQLLFKVESPYLNRYYQLSRYIEEINLNKTHS